MGARWQDGWVGMHIDDHGALSGLALSGKGGQDGVGCVQACVDVGLAVGEADVVALEVNRQLIDAALHELTAVVDEASGVVAQQICVRVDGATNDAGDEDRTEARHPYFDAVAGGLAMALPRVVRSGGTPTTAW